MSATQHEKAAAVTQPGGSFAWCTCEWRGPVRETRAEAETDAAAHRSNPGATS